MRMLKHGRLTSGGATFLDYFFSPCSLRPGHETGQRLGSGRGGPRRAGSIPRCWSCRMSNALRREILLIVCKRSLGFMSHFRFFRDLLPRLVPVRGRPFGRILWFANGRGASPPRRKTPRVRFSRPTSVTSAAAARGKPQDGARGHPAAHRTRTRRKGGRRTHPSLQPLRAASRGGSRSAARRTAAASRSPLGFRRLDAPAQGACPS